MFKKIFYIMSIMFVLFFIYTPVEAVNWWYSTDIDTVAWDANIDVTTPSYRIYIATFDVGLDAMGAENVLAEITELTYTIPFTSDMAGYYIIGVTTVENSGQTDEAESAINWSYVNGVSTPEPFGFLVESDEVPVPADVNVTIEVIEAP